VPVAPCLWFSGERKRCNQGIRLPMNAGQSKSLFWQYRTLFH
jgi:hypothetical protein